MRAKEYIKHRKKIFSSQAFFILSVLIPIICYYSVFKWYPFIYAIILSFYKYTLRSKHFIGLTNFAEAFTEDSIFLISLKNTVYYVAMIVPTEIILGLIFALMINRLQKRKSADVFRTIYFLPVITCLVACCITWRWLYQPLFGLFNIILGSIGLPRLKWLMSTKTALLSIAVMRIWKDLGIVIVLLLAGLQGIPRTFHESSMIDGANRWQTLIYITIPLLVPTIIFVIIIEVINTFQAFSEILIMTSGLAGSATTAGGPLNSTITVVLHIYMRAFNYFRMGYASGLSMILFIIIIIFTIVQLRISRIKWKY